MSQKRLETIIFYKIYNIKDMTMTGSMVCLNLLPFIDLYALYVINILNICDIYCSCIYFNDCFYIQIESRLTLRLIKKLFNLISKLF